MDFIVGKGKGDIFIRIFLSKEQKKNDYSELMIYNKKEEVIASIFPKYGRVVLWNDNTDFIFKPPSMNVEQAEYSLLIKMTKDKTKFTKSMEKFKVSYLFSPFFITTLMQSICHISKKMTNQVSPIPGFGFQQKSFMIASYHRHQLHGGLKT